MILVFGKTGQVAIELSKFENIQVLNREQADLTNPQACKKVILSQKPKAVINAAAYTAVDNAESDEYLARRINGEAPAKMADACAELEIPFVHISSDYVFDGSGITPWHCLDTPSPKNVYGRSKLEGEKGVESSGCVFAILRTSWVVSQNGNNFLKTMLKLSQTKEFLNVVDDQIGGPTFARDIAKTCIAIAQQLVEQPDKAGIYHYSGQPDVSWCQFANTIFEDAGCLTVANPIPTSSYFTAASRPLNSRLDCSSTEDVFGISRPFWRDELRITLQELGQINDKT
ncbi:dTDP-4-dehydrorhamnose reductase [Amylibacter sp.]|nr:dTDP-4-dehydrorhamnose reductase [Amylibacter sp.]